VTRYLRTSAGLEWSLYEEKDADFLGCRHSWAKPRGDSAFLYRLTPSTRSVDRAGIVNEPLWGPVVLLENTHWLCLKLGWFGMLQGRWRAG
jgi:hypothetical protein